MLFRKFIKVPFGSHLLFLFALMFLADQRQFASVQPIASAIWTLVHFDFSAGAEEMAHHRDVVAFRTLPLFRIIDLDRFVLGNVPQELGGIFLRFIKFLQFEIIEPDAAAPTITNIDSHLTGLHRGDVIFTNWTFHNICISDSRLADHAFFCCCRGSVNKLASLGKRNCSPRIDQQPNSYRRNRWDRGVRLEIVQKRR